VLHVNHESRQEALRFYRRVDFTTVRANQVMQPGYVSCGSIWTYYNPNADIVLFAEKTCMNTIVRFLEDQRTNMIPIVRIAILTSGMTLNCHGWRGNDPIECAQKLTIAGGCSPMQALHGIDPAVAQNSLVLGVRGLEDVYWVVPSELLPLRAGDIDESVGFRNAVGDGLMNGQKCFKELIAADIAIVEGGSPLPKCGSFDYWSGPNKPSFHFVSFSPHPAPGKVFDSLPILTATIPKLKFKSWERVKKIAQQTGCHIKVCVEHYIEQQRREVGFYGTPEQVPKAKEAVKNFLICSHFNNQSSASWVKLIYLECKSELGTSSTTLPRNCLRFHVVHLSRLPCDSRSRIYDSCTSSHEVLINGLIGFTSLYAVAY